MKKLILLALFLFLVPFSGTSFTQWHQTLSPVVGSVFCLTSDSTRVFAGADSGVYITTDNGVNWAQTNNGLSKSAFVISLAVSGSDIFAGSYLGGVFRSTNYGSNWTQMDNGLPASFTVFALAVNDTNIFAGTDGGGVYRSTNNGAAWLQMNNGLTNTSVRSFLVNSSGIFAGTADGVFFSSDNGAIWKLSGLNNNSYIYSFISAGSDIFAGTINGVQLSADNGSSWTYAGLNLNVLTLAANDTVIFAGTDNSGVYITGNNGVKWSSANDGLTDNYVRSLVVKGNSIFAATNSAGAWKRPLSEFITGVSDEANVIPKDFSLSQNYPNPFNPNTIISYSLPLASNVKLIVYNTLGQTIRLLDNSYKHPGNYSVSFNASNLPGGVYFYKLDAGQFSQIKKMILLK